MPVILAEGDWQRSSRARATSDFGRSLDQSGAETFGENREIPLAHGEACSEGKSAGNPEMTKGAVDEDHAQPQFRLDSPSAMVRPWARNTIVPPLSEWLCYRACRLELQGEPSVQHNQATCADLTAIGRIFDLRSDSATGRPLQDGHANP